MHDKTSCGLYRDSIVVTIALVCMTRPAAGLYRDSIVVTIALVCMTRRAAGLYRDSIVVTIALVCMTRPAAVLFLCCLYEAQGELLQSPRSSMSGSHCVKVLCSSFSEVHISATTHQTAFIF